MTGRPVLVFSCTPFSLTHGEAMAFDGDRVCHMVVQLAELERAPLVKMVQDRADSVPAAKALILDAHGRVITSPEGHA